MRTREERRKVVVRARMRDGTTWQDITVLNLSSRGMLVRAADEPPTRGNYVEIRRLDQVIVARVVWQKASLFGVRTQDRIDMAKLTSQRPAAGDAGRSPAATASDRRTAARSAEEQAARSQRLSRTVQWTTLAAGIGFAALVIGMTLWETLSRPMQAVRTALG